MGKDPKKPSVPDHLSDASGEWWESVIGSYALDPHHVRILTHAAEAWDRADEAREQIAKDGLIVCDRFQQEKAHPAVAIESVFSPGKK